MLPDLRKLIEDEIINIDIGDIDSRVISYNNYKSKYTVLKPSVIIEISLTDGKVAKLDITDYFEGVVK